MNKFLKRAILTEAVTLCGAILLTVLFGYIVIAGGVFEANLLTVTLCVALLLLGVACTFFAAADLCQDLAVALALKGAQADSEEITLQIEKTEPLARAVIFGRGMYYVYGFSFVSGKKKYYLLLSEEAYSSAQNLELISSFSGKYRLSVRKSSVIVDKFDAADALISQLEVKRKRTKRK